MWAWPASTAAIPRMRREKRPDLKVRFITGYVANATLANGFLEPGMAMLTKSFAVDAYMRKTGEVTVRDPP